MNGTTWLVSVCLVLGVLQRSASRPLIRDANMPPKKSVLDFMKRFGYLPPDSDTSAALYTEEGLSDVIKEIQKFGALPQTGILDNSTLQLISAPRCGVADKQNYKRSKRYILGSRGWNKRNITYFVANWPPTLGEYKTKKDIQLALTTWGKYGQLHFQEINSPDADIVVFFAAGPHGDQFPFDGQGSVLAHAFFPYEYDGLAGDAHFDADEHWTKQPNDDGIYFYAVALHELGHSIGLAHSTVSSSIMFPYYKESGHDLNLDYDDILGMYELYIRNGPKESHLITTTPKTYIPTTERNEATVRYDETTEKSSTSTAPTVPDICLGNIDAAATLRQELFIFKGEYVWRLREKNIIEPNYPVPIRHMFPNLPDRIKRIDAAYERPDGIIVLFAGREVWIYDGYKFIENSPQPLTIYGLPSELDKIDAVQIWAKNSKTYLYRGDLFWRFNETTKMVDPGYPMDMGRWRGVPSDLDAAVTWKDGITYFFKGKEFWKFDNIWVLVTDTSPMPIAQVWLGCPKEVDLY